MANPKIVVMGVSGCGKSTVGELLAEELGVPFKDGDELHPAANIEKMSAGIPLNDDDRWPWLRDVAAWLNIDGGVVGCSALKRSYRDLLREEAPGVVFAHLEGPEDLLRARMYSRPGHFMLPEMLRSQLDTLEPLRDDEPGTAFSISTPPAELAREIAAWVSAR